MVFEDKFEYVHSNKKKILENSSLALANTGTEETEGLVGVGLTPPPPLARFEMVEETSKEAKLADQVGYGLFLSS